MSDTDPKLEPAGLTDNGGPTQTIALLPGSPAINAGDPKVCADPPVNGVDQRGFPRPGRGHANCSIGAYEYSFPPPTPTATPMPAPTATPQPSGDDGGGCTVTPIHGSAAWWLVAPTLVLAWARRRQRG